MELRDIKKEVEFREAKEALALYEKGYTLRQVGKALKMSHETVRTRINALIKDTNSLTVLDK